MKKLGKLEKVPSFMIHKSFPNSPT